MTRIKSGLKSVFIRGSFLGASLWLRSLAPKRLRRFLRSTINRTLFQHAHRFLYGALELWISTSDHILRPVLDVDVRRNPFVLHRPLSVTCEETAARRDHAAAV